MFHTIMAPAQALPWLSIAAFCGYLIGSVPFGMILARLFRLGDLRRIGSGNIGATNVLRTGNKLAAALTLLLDGAKGAVPVILFLSWGDLAAQLAGLGAVLGHCHPVWLRFRGGKGVATFIGVMLGLHWPTGLAICGVWLVVALVGRISSLAALCASLSAPIWLGLMGRWDAVLVAIVLAAWIWLRHYANITRLIRGTEPRIGDHNR